MLSTRINVSIRSFLNWLEQFHCSNRKHTGNAWLAEECFYHYDWLPSKMTASYNAESIFRKICYLFQTKLVSNMCRVNNKTITNLLNKKNSKNMSISWFRNFFIIIKTSNNRRCDTPIAECSPHRGSNS